MALADNHRGGPKPAQVAVEFVLSVLRVQRNECCARRNTEVAEGHLRPTRQHHDHTIAARDPQAMQGGSDCQELCRHIRKSKGRPTRRDNRLHI